MEYLATQSVAQLPEIATAPAFKAVLIADLAWHYDAQHVLCDWLLASGCVYVMVAGLHGAGWKSMFDATNLAQFDFGAIPDKRVIIATEHPHESLRDIIWFSRYSAMHPLHDLRNLVWVDLTSTPREAEINRLVTEAA